jgi:hypothetical protein
MLTVELERSNDMTRKSNASAGMRSRALILAIGLAKVAISPAFADMPNPNVQQWTDHQQPPVKFGSDLESQHYATAAITAPDSKGAVSIEMTCENGKRGSNFTAWFSVLFRHGDTVLASTKRVCQLNRDSMVFSHVKDSQTTVVDLSKVLDQVDNVQTHLTHGVPAILPLSK